MLVHRRVETIEKNAHIALIEQPEHKRRWNDEPWETRQERALRGWLLDRLESQLLWSEPRLTTTSALADRMRDNEEFLQVAELYMRRPDFDVADLVARLVEDESVPLHPVLRYKPSGRRKREAWDHTWELQRREDAIDARTALPATDPGHLTAEAAAMLKAADIGPIPVPPRYTSADFQKSTWWRLRGKLDLPKERFVSLPGCERDADPSLVIGWAGWNALDQSRAVAEHLMRMREREGWTAERLAPLLAALLELLPWVRQYHNAPDPEFGIGMGDYFEGFIDEEARALSLTHESIRAWAPPEGRRRRGGRRKKLDMTLIRDLIEIPQQIHRDDFVLRLAEGVSRPSETLRTYVVTPQLADAFDRALGLIRDALASGSSKAALSARELRERQEPLHGRAPPAAAAGRRGAPSHRGPRGCRNPA